MLRKFHNQDWITVERRQGEVNALHRLRGFALEHNGPMLRVETELGDIIEVHKDWFIYDAKERDESTAKQTMALTPRQKTDTILAAIARGDFDTIATFQSA